MTEKEELKIERVRVWLTEQLKILEKKYSDQKNQNHPNEDPLSRIRGMFQVLITGKPNFQNPLQRPYAFYLPGLPSQPFFDKHQFSFVKTLEDSFLIIKKELLSILPSDGKLQASSGFQLYNGDGIEADKGMFSRTGDWRVFYFFKNFEQIKENCQACPKTTEILLSCPEFLRGMVCFSILDPGAYIVPHTGPSNMRLTCHLGLTGCEGTTVFVGRECRPYTEGQCVIFDDSYIHSVKHAGSERRVTLMLDFWHPQVTEIERTAFNELLFAAATNSAGFDVEEFCHSLHLYSIHESGTSFSTIADDLEDSEDDETEEKG